MLPKNAVGCNATESVRSCQTYVAANWRTSASVSLSCLLQGDAGIESRQDLKFKIGGLVQPVLAWNQLLLH